MSEDEYEATAWKWQDEGSASDREDSEGPEEDVEAALYAQLHLNSQADDPTPIASPHFSDTWNVHVEEPRVEECTLNSKDDCKEDTSSESQKDSLVHTKGVSAPWDGKKSKHLGKTSLGIDSNNKLLPGKKSKLKTNEINSADTKHRSIRSPQVIVIDSSSSACKISDDSESESSSESDTDSDSVCSVSALLGVSKHDLEEAGLITNIRDRPESATNQQSGEETLQQILDSLPPCDWSVDVQDRFTTVGPSALRSRYYKPIQVMCRNCNIRGHLSRDCPQPKKVTGCIQCGDTGHRVNQCPDPKCWNCQTVGHMNRDCPEPRRPAQALCMRCGMKGHLRKLCTDIWRQFHMTTVTCDYPCFVAKKVNPRKYCFNCAKKGHFGFECRLPPGVHNTYAANPFVKKYDRAQRDMPVDDRKQSGKKRRREDASSSPKKAPKFPKQHTQHAATEWDGRVQLGSHGQRRTQEQDIGKEMTKKKNKKKKKAKRLQESTQGFPRGPVGSSFDNKNLGSTSGMAHRPNTRQQVQYHSPAIGSSFDHKNLAGNTSGMVHRPNTRHQVQQDFPRNPQFNLMNTGVTLLPNLSVQLGGKARGGSRQVFMQSRGCGQGASKTSSIPDKSGGGTQKRASASHPESRGRRQGSASHQYRNNQGHDRRQMSKRGFFY